MIDILPLGVGRGADGVLLGHCSSSYVITRNLEPILLFDVGFGVVRQYLKHFPSINCPIYVSHNHSDHAAELPVIGALARTQRVEQPLYASKEVLKTLKNHRLNELKSTGKPLSSFFDFHELASDEHSQTIDVLAINTVQGQHSERSYGLIVSCQNKPVLSISSDSGFNQAIYDRLAVSPIVILDGRETGSSEHASFSEIESWAAERPSVSVWVSGYGETDYVPNAFSLVKPHQKIEVTL